MHFGKGDQISVAMILLYIVTAIALVNTIKESETIRLKIAMSISPEIKRATTEMELIILRLKTNKREIDERCHYLQQIKKVLDGVNIGTNPGYIYIMRRSDGIYKIGRTRNTKQRLKQHEIDYNAGFSLVTRFVVPDVTEFEKLALSMTGEYEFKEDGRTELRKMTRTNLDTFTIEFNAICEAAISL